jgi:hypothetical protein
MSFKLLSEDELIALLLIYTWTLITGKTLRCDVPPQELTEEELIDFWSDDHFDSAAGHWQASSHSTELSFWNNGSRFGAEFSINTPAVAVGGRPIPRTGTPLTAPTGAARYN